MNCSFVFPVPVLVPVPGDEYGSFEGEAKADAIGNGRKAGRFEDLKDAGI
jgi:hypothetical protein